MISIGHYSIKSTEQKKRGEEMHQFLNSGRNIFPTHETRLTSSPSYQKPGARPPWSKFLKTYCG